MVLGVPMDDLFPSYDERTQVLARDALASVDAFWIIVLAAYEHLFGLRVCPRCPDCNAGKDNSVDTENGTMPCQDFYGSNATSAGGIFGRIDAAYAAVEAQKSTGALHAHLQLFIQCLHQHTPLAEILKRLRERHDDTIDRYLKYNAHVSRTIYEEVGEALEKRLALKEQEWPEFKRASAMISCPRYLRSVPDESQGATSQSEKVDEGKQWMKSFLPDVQNLQEYKQHHVHPMNSETGERELVTGCRRKDNPDLCKGDFPRT